MFKSRTFASAAVVALLVSVSLASVASAGTRKGSTLNAAGSGCTVSGNVLEATGLPNDVVVNLFMTDGSGTYGWALGLTSDGTGTWTTYVPDRTGPTTYEFASTTFGKEGSKYYVYASCSAS